MTVPMVSAPLCAALCAALAVWSLFLPSRPALRLRGLLGLPSRSSPGSDARSSFERTKGIVRRAGLLVGFWRARRRLESQWQAGVITLCDGIGAELSAGRAPEAALARSIAALDPELAAVLRVEWAGRGVLGPDGVPQAGLEVPQLLERVARHPGAHGLRLLAACWRIGAERGGSFASVVEGLASALRDEQAHREEVMAQLAGPRATARLLAGLPVLGLAMGGALGAHPLSFLFGTLPGVVCLILGVGLDAVGLWWTRQLVSAAQEPR
jgi:tight adherence protein B